MVKKDLENIFSNLPIPAFRYFTETDSTNTQALKWLGDGAQEYSLVIADSQTLGRGRNGRKWITTPGSSIATSIILHPNQREVENLGLFSLLGGFIVAEVLEDMYAIKAQVKWPNDVLIENRKTAGILSEALWQGETLQAIVLGIGINLLLPSVPSEEELLFPATCLEAHTNQKINPELILANLVEHLIRRRADLLKSGFIKDYEDKLVYKGQFISLDSGMGEITTGLLKGIDAFGNVRVEDPDGIERTYPIGDLKLRPA